MKSRACVCGGRGGVPWLLYNFHELEVPLTAAHAQDLGPVYSCRGICCVSCPRPESLTVVDAVSASIQSVQCMPASADLATQHHMSIDTAIYSLQVVI